MWSNSVQIFSKQLKNHAKSSKKLAIARKPNEAQELLIVLGALGSRFESRRHR